MGSYKDSYRAKTPMRKHRETRTMTTINEKLGTFAKLAEKFMLTDADGNPMTEIVVGKTVVHGPWRLVTKDQIAIVIGIVTSSMCNTKDKDGKPVFKFQGNGWEPEAYPGDVLLQDRDNPMDNWACKPDLFDGTGWVGTIDPTTRALTYAKPGKPLIALDIPEGTKVVSLEGDRIAEAGLVLAMTKPDKGDFYAWTPDVVNAYVRPYSSTAAAA